MTRNQASDTSNILSRLVDACRPVYREDKYTEHHAGTLYYETLEAAARNTLGDLSVTEAYILFRSLEAYSDTDDSADDSLQSAALWHGYWLTKCAVLEGEARTPTELIAKLELFCDEIQEHDLGRERIESIKRSLIADVSRMMPHCMVA